MSRTRSCHRNEGGIEESRRPGSGRGKRSVECPWHVEQELNRCRPLHHPATSSGGVKPRFRLEDGELVLGELERAREAFTHGIANDPRHIKCLQWRALVLRDLDDDRAAVEDLARALECIESADEATLTSWGGNRRSLLMKTLNLCLQAFHDLGPHDAAMRDRERYERLNDGSAP